MYKVDVPYWVMLGKKKPKPFYLNLNTYRNAHFQTLNKAKEAFYDLCKDRLANIPFHLQVALTYTLYTKTNQLCDTANICCIVDKFFCDSLVGYEKIPDDNYQIVKSVDFRFGGVDKSNPRVEVSIEPMGLNEGSTAAHDQTDHYLKEKVMQITLVQKEIETALRRYVTSSVDVQEGKDINITLRATRGVEGYQAVIDIVDAADGGAGNAGNNELTEENGEQSGKSASSGSTASSSTATGASTSGGRPQVEPEVAQGESKPAGSLFSKQKEPENA